MRAIIIEDEAIAVEVLLKMLGEMAPEIEVVACLQSVSESIDWIQKNELPDLAFVDIHLADGSSFTIFEECKFDCPIIFTTAYDQYAIKAFDVCSVGYLLKPIEKERLRIALGRIKNREGVRNQQQLLEQLMGTLRGGDRRTYRQNILITQKDKLLPVSVGTIACFYIDGRQVIAITSSGKEYRVDMTLDELQGELNPRKFFRVNRQFIVQHAAVKELTQWFSGKYVLGLHVDCPEKIIIPKAKVTPLKEWLATGES